MRVSPRHLIMTLLLVSSAVHSTGSNAKTLYVEKWGSNLNPCSRAAPCATISNAILKSSKNGRIKIGPGLYRENLLIFNNNDNEPLDGLKLESTAGRFATFLRADNVNLPVIRIFRPKVRIGKKGRGFSIEFSTNDSGVWISSSNTDRARVEGNLIRGNNIGIEAWGDRIQIRDNIVEDSDEMGIQCSNCDRGLIRGNRVRDTALGGGVAVAFSEKLSFQQNVVRRHFVTAISFDNTNEALKVKDNVSSSTGIGSGLSVSGSVRGTIQGNISSFSDTYGISIGQTHPGKGPVVKNNLATTNSFGGISLGALQSPVVERNTAADNSLGAGITINAGIFAPKIRNNNTFLNDAPNGCGIQNSSLSATSHGRHFFGGTDTLCGFSMMGVELSKPTGLKVNGARKL